jgi:hypothetical protein
MSHGLSVFNVLHRGIFGSEREETPEDWRKLHNEELHNLLPSKYYSADQIKKENVHATRL